MTIKLYKTSSDKRVVDKVLTGEKTLSGTIYEETDLLNPVFDINMFTGFADYNYAYIEDFGGRYYYIKIDIIDGSRLRVTCAVDPLKSWWNKGLKDCTVHITRQEKEGNYYLYDDRYQITGKYYTQVKKSSPPFTIRTPGETNVHTYILNAM